MSLSRLGGLIRGVPPYTAALVIMCAAVVASLAIDARQTHDRLNADRQARIDVYVLAEVSGCQQTNESRRLVADAGVQLSVSIAETNAEALQAIFPVPASAVANYVHNIRLDAEAIAATYPQLDCHDVAVAAESTARLAEEGL